MNGHLITSFSTIEAIISLSILTTALTKPSEVKAWAKGQGFREYDPGWINKLLKGIAYKKTEWDKNKHDRNKIIEDRYRKE